MPLTTRLQPAVPLSPPPAMDNHQWQRNSGIRRYGISASSAKLPLADRMVTLAKGQKLIEEGEPVTAWIAVETGILRSCHLLADGRRQINRFIFENEWLLPDTKSCNRSIEAVTETTLHMLPKKDVGNLLRTQPELVSDVLETVQAELQGARDQILLLGRKTALERMASFFLLLSRHVPQRPPHPAAFPLTIGRSDIADYLGLTVETVSRVTSTMRRTGLITCLGKGMIRLDRQEELERIAAHGMPPHLGWP